MDVFVAVEFTKAAVAVVFSTATGSLEGRVTLLFEAALLEGVGAGVGAGAGAVGSEATEEVEVSGGVTRAAVLCSGLAAVVVTACVDELVGAD